MNRYDYSRIANLEPNQNVLETIVQNFQFIKSKKYTSINNYSSNFIFVIDDLNINYKPHTSSVTSTLEFARQVIETRRFNVTKERGQFCFDHVNFMFTCSSPGILNF